MIKLISILLIVSGVLSLFAGFFIDLKYGGNASLTGNVVSNILTQPEINLSFFDYLEGVIFSCSIVSFIMGFVFLFRV